ncbi:ABC transporter substrate-binding protein [Entomospira culicis]|uniref:ABC transporter substrate-binding protein n=1 Tax=Entomospira culicis TaxID=2719989 RepID=A0A968GE44_9SPIO|nr:ABC transporter substrate-binding protein [Entomospira culicis]NIZ18691.1 ABC transporter substrate-binding protein [Entomospira culicis]NIZ68906.1 ABC transporter substrate-binding protein [Entomospira culicis]WDI37499.1 ABC transporter substrate-binding protein [Entomospira culicis]WDI39127.1 ABC transporter substrate-binding protein [Entomospira culicis]
MMLLLLLVGCNPDKKSQPVGKSIMVGVPNPRTPIDTHLSPLAAVQSIYNHMVETLYTVDEEMNIVPLLAKALPTISEDALHYTFTLRDDVYFHDGSHLTSRDVQFLFERLFDPQTPGVSNAFYKEVAGSDAYFAGEAQSISGFTIIDDYTFTIELSRPSLAFVDALSMGYAGIIPRESFLAHQETWGHSVLIGSGPYRFVRYHPNEGVIMEVNEAYRDGRSAIDRIEFRYMDDAYTALLEYEQGNLDVVELNPDQYAQYASGNYRDEIHRWNTLGTNVIFINTKHQDLGNPLVRKALLYALDRDDIAEHVYQHLADKVDNFVPVGSVGYNPHITLPKHSTQRAKELLAEAGYNEPLNIEVVYTSGKVLDRQLWTLAQAQLKEAGINLIIKEADAAAFLDLTMSGQVYLHNRAWLLPYPDGSIFLDYLHGTSSHRASVNYQNPELDDILERAQASPDANERRALYEEAERILVEEATVVIPLTNQHIFNLVKPHLINMKRINSLYQFQESDIVRP